MTKTNEEEAITRLEVFAGLLLARQAGMSDPDQARELASDLRTLIEALTKARQIIALRREGGGNAELVEKLAEAINDRNEHAAHVLRMARECEAGLAALTEIDEAWEQFGIPNNRQTLTLPEQIASTLRELEEALSPAPSEGGEPVATWRPEVRAFADLMEAQLRANDHKPGWKEESPTFDLLPRLFEEAEELREVFEPGTRGPYEDWSSKVGREAADVANFAMMIADVCGALTLSPPPLVEREEAQPLVTGPHSDLTNRSAQSERYRKALEEIRATLADSSLMEAWDGWRKMHSEGFKGTLTRDQFEMFIDSLDAIARQALTTTNTGEA